MIFFATILSLATGQGSVIEAVHASNSLYTEISEKGVTVDNATIRLPSPKFVDGQPIDSRRELIREIAGSVSSAEEFLKDSVTAPFILKLRDEKLPDATIRNMDLWFAVHADLDALDFAESRRQASAPTELANMRFESRILSAEQLKARNLPVLEPNKERMEWYTHLDARLLDRISIRATDHVFITRSAESLVLATKTDTAFSNDREFPNQWQALDRIDPSKSAGPLKAYPGGVSYVKISKFGDGSTTLLVEAHFAFVEPAPWFDRGPILRSKFAPIAQDQIRRLRRQVASKKTKRP